MKPLQHHQAVRSASTIPSIVGTITCIIVSDKEKVIEGQVHNNVVGNCELPSIHAEVSIKSCQTLTPRPLPEPPIRHVITSSEAGSQGSNAMPAIMSMPSYPEGQAISLPSLYDGRELLEDNSSEASSLTNSSSDISCCSEESVENNLSGIGDRSQEKCCNRRRHPRLSQRNNINSLCRKSRNKELYYVKQHQTKELIIWKNRLSRDNLLPITSTSQQSREDDNDHGLVQLQCSNKRERKPKKKSLCSLEATTISMETLLSATTITATSFDRFVISDNAINEGGGEISASSTLSSFVVIKDKNQFSFNDHVINSDVTQYENTTGSKYEDLLGINNEKKQVSSSKLVISPSISPVTSLSFTGKVTDQLQLVQERSATVKSIKNNYNDKCKSLNQRYYTASGIFNFLTFCIAHTSCYETLYHLHLHTFSSLQGMFIFIEQYQNYWTSVYVLTLISALLSYRLCGGLYRSWLTPQQYIRVKYELSNLKRYLPYNYDVKLLIYLRRFPSLTKFITIMSFYGCYVSVGYMMSDVVLPTVCGCRGGNDVVKNLPSLQYPHLQTSTKTLLSTTTASDLFVSFFEAGAATENIEESKDYEYVHDSITAANEPEQCKNIIDEEQRQLLQEDIEMDDMVYLYSKLSIPSYYKWLGWPGASLMKAQCQYGFYLSWSVIGIASLYYVGMPFSAS